MTCKLNLPPTFKLNLSSINPTIHIKKAIDVIKFKFLSETLNKSMERTNAIEIAIPPVNATGLS